MTAIEIPTPDPRTFDDAARPFAEAVSAHYAIKKMIGRGGMGIVYLARDKRLDRLVAIKTLPPQLASDPSVRERFIRETRAAGGMSHPNIVPIHGADEIDGHVFFVMGFVDGDSLATHVSARGPLEPRVVTALLHDVASALSHAHRRGIIHRDVKAENILIDRMTGRALVTDFGIARLAAAAPLTATGQLLGTVYYVSPEQVAGEPVDQRSDLYSLGVVGFLALTGQFPFDAELASAVLVQHVTRPAPSTRATNPNVPKALAAIIDRCLSKSPADRFATADDFLTALDAAAKEDAGESKPAPGVRRLISDTEAHAVWQRAADLQSFTGARNRPEIVVRSRDTEKDRARTSGFSLTEVRSAANQAGIGDAYVERALVERGLGGETPATRPPTPKPKSATRNSLWAGAPLDIVVDADVNGNVDPRRFNELLNTLREGTGTLGVTAPKSQDLSWTSGWFGHRLEATVWSESRQGKVRLTQSLRRSALAVATGSLVGGGAVGLVGGVITRIVLSLRTPDWFPRGALHLGRDGRDAIAIATGVVITVACVRMGRSLIRRIREYNAARLQTLTDLVALRAGASERDD